MRTSNYFTLPGKHFDLILDLHRGNITVQQKWLYSWVASKAADGKTWNPKWTYQEKKAFHSSCDAAIWKWWSHHYKLKVSGDSIFAKKFKDKALPLNFDLKWVLQNEHYKVYVSKGRPPSGHHKAERVNWSSRRMWLWASSTKMNNHSRVEGGVAHPQGKSTHTQNVVAHEFGHTLNYDGLHDNTDEYKHNSIHCEDLNSMMNVGWELRGRHISLVLKMLDDEMLDTTFEISKRR